MNPVILTEDMLEMVEKINKRREAGRIRAKRFYDLHAEEFKQKRLEKKHAKQVQKKEQEVKKEPMKRGRKIKPVDINDVMTLMVNKNQESDDKN